MLTFLKIMGFIVIMLNLGKLAVKGPFRWLARTLLVVIVMGACVMLTASSPASGQALLGAACVLGGMALALVLGFVSWIALVRKPRKS